MNAKKHSWGTKRVGSGSAARRPEAGSVRTVVVVATAFVIGVGVTTLWMSRTPGQRLSVGGVMEERSGLSQASLRALAGLGEPVEIRYHVVLDPATVPAATVEFSQRVARLLDAYVRASDGRLKVVRQQGAPEEAVNAAAADQMKAFNQDLGDPCFLGLALSSGGRRELLPQLSPDWEAALESDLTRALVRVSTPPADASASLATGQPSAAAMETIRSVIPDLPNISIEDGTQMLRDRALRGFTEATKEMQTRLEAAQQLLLQAQNGGTETEQHAALETLKRTQAEQTEKLKAISAELQEQIAALEYLKKK